MIGGGSAAERNIISGNGINGYGIGNIFLQTLGTVVQGNYIGTDWTGTLQVADDIRDGVGIWMQDDKDSLIADNLIAGNDIGIRIDGRWVTGGTENTRIQGNRIGTNRDGNSPLINRYGVYIAGHVDSDGVTHPINNVLIGGTNDGAGNVISGNISSGIKAFGPGVQNLRIQGNSVGTTADGMAALGNGGAGVEIDDVTGVTIGGTVDRARNIISGNTGSGISITAGGGHTVQGNYIGTTADGMSKLGNGASGVLVTDSSGNRIGGVGDEARNVISGNTAGIAIEGPLSSGNRVTANYIGVGRDGLTRVDNLDGVVVSGGAAENLIGGLSEGERNVISGNTRTGIFVTGTETTLIQGNYIGTDATGTLAVGNRSVGVILLATTNTVIGGTHPGAGNLISGNGVGIALGATIITRSTRVEGNRIGTKADGREAIGNNIGIQVTGSAGYQVVDATIGGLAPGAGNLISGNATQGILVRGDGASEIRIQGNLVGTDLDGDGAIGNGASGILIQDANGVLIGGTDALAANRISGNLGNGISVTGNAIGNTIRGNAIYANAGLGIDLGGNGVTLNDPLDSDSGPNQLQNFPALRAVLAGNSTFVSGTLNSLPNANFTIDFYASSVLDSTGYGEGARWLGAIEVQTDAQGFGQFRETLAAPTAPGEFITATATDSTGNTSEFSGGFMATGKIGKKLIVGGGLGTDNVNLSQGSVVVTINGEIFEFEDDGSTEVEVHLLGGDDTLISTIANNTVAYGGDGDDFIQLGSGNDQAFGEAGNDTLLLGSGDDIADGGTGNDHIDGQAGHDHVTTGDGNDSVATDADDDLGEFAFQILAPISLTEDTVVRGQRLILSASYPDPVSTIHWSFGNGEIGDGPLVSHAYSTEGTYHVELQVTDAQGNLTTIGRDLSVGVIGLQVDPVDPSETALAIGGTQANDKIHVNRHRRTESVKVLLNGDDLGTYSPTGHLLIYAQDGNDRVQVAGSVHLATWIFGGPGNDYLNGGNGPNLIWGGPGNDLLIGGSSSDLLIGGPGFDILIGSGGHDIRLDRNHHFVAGILSHFLTTTKDRRNSNHSHRFRFANLRSDCMNHQFGQLARQGIDTARSRDEEADKRKGSADSDWASTELKDRITYQQFGELLEEILSEI